MPIVVLNARAFFDMILKTIRIGPVGEDTAGDMHEQGGSELRANLGLLKKYKVR